MWLLQRAYNRVGILFSELRGTCNATDVTCLMFPVIKRNNRVAELHRRLAEFSL